jgi:glutamine amidotransferase
VTAVALIDYGAGNLTSVRKALTHLGATVVSPGTPAELRDAAGVIVPGVGHFQATAALDAEWRGTIGDLVAEGRPLLGICLGMQWLFAESTEAPDVAGLGVIGGCCERLSGRSPAGGPRDVRLKVPHVGWNGLNLRGASTLLEGVDDRSYAYFTHSFAAPITQETVATTEYGDTFASVVERGLVFGVQFHPEKSGDVGLKILGNFLRTTGRR